MLSDIFSHSSQDQFDRYARSIRQYMIEQRRYIPENRDPLASEPEPANPNLEGFQVRYPRHTHSLPSRESGDCARPQGIPDWVVEWCAEHNHTEPALEEGRWRAYPPGAVMSVPIPRIQRPKNPINPRNAFAVSRQMLPNRYEERIWTNELISRHYGGDDRQRAEADELIRHSLNLLPGFERDEIDAMISRNQPPDPEITWEGINREEAHREVDEAIAALWKVLQRYVADHPSSVELFRILWAASRVAHRGIESRGLLP